MFRVSLFSGALCHYNTDFALAWIWPLEFTRSYSSDRLRNGPLGFGWTMPFDRFITVDSEKLTLVEEDDSPIEIYFKDLDEQGFDEKSSTYVELRSDSIMLRRDGVRLVFLARPGESRVPVSLMKDAGGNWFHLTYGPGNNLVQIKDR